MGYNSTPELITQNLSLVESILSKVDRDEPAVFRVGADANIQTEQYRLRRVLAACDAFRSAHSGRFAGLGARCSIAIDYEKKTLVVRPKGGVNIKRFRPTEKDAVEFLIEQKGSLAMVEFFPSEIYSDDAFLRDALTAGWKVQMATKMIEGEKISFAAEKVGENESRATGFAALGGG
jgi:hypothetical protein